MLQTSTDSDQSKLASNAIAPFSIQHDKWVTRYDIISLIKPVKHDKMLITKKIQDAKKAGFFLF